MDMHLYHMTSILARLISARRYVQISRWLYRQVLRYASWQQPVIVGEWSIVLKGDKLRHLNQAEARRLMSEFGQAQLEVYERYSIGWFYWSYKTEQPDIWNMRSLVEDGTLSIPR